MPGYAGGPARVSGPPLHAVGAVPPVIAHIPSAWLSLAPLGCAAGYGPAGLLPAGFLRAGRRRCSLRRGREIIPPPHPKGQRFHQRKAPLTVWVAGGIRAITPRPKNYRLTKQQKRGIL